MNPVEWVKVSLKSCSWSGASPSALREFPALALSSTKESSNRKSRLHGGALTLKGVRENVAAFTGSYRRSTCTGMAKAHRGQRRWEHPC